MDDGREKGQECYNFTGIRDLWKKCKWLAVKGQHRHHPPQNPNQAINGDMFKGDRQEKKVPRNGNKTSWDHSHDCHHTSCLQTIILLSSPKKKQFSVSDNHHHYPASTIELSSNTPIHSFRRSESMNNHHKGSEQWSTTPNISRAASINWTMSGCSYRSLNGRMNTRSGPVIMFSTSSSGVLKPPPTEHHLECSLDELCRGCVKQINLSNHVYTNTGQIVQQHKLYRVEVKPGWRRGTKITFQGSSSKGEYCGDVVFIISEKDHPLLRRNEDNLEMEIQIPLMEALTGCTVTIPWLGNENDKDKMSKVTIDEVVYPGYKRIIAGQGMPSQKKPDQRGDLILNFLVHFPLNLTLEQRSQLSTILTL